jgi:hypothetical protein
MGFSDRQVRALARGVPAKAIRSRTVSGKELTYIEGWYALTQANRIFGFDGWDRETVETKCLQGREARGNYTAIYSARVRVTVHTDGRVVVREGHGTGEAYGSSVGEVHDRALKAAETDATKRALATFGKAFGLALYNGNGKMARKKANGHDAASPVQVHAGADQADGAADDDHAKSSTDAATASPASSPANGDAGSRGKNWANNEGVYRAVERIDQARSAPPIGTETRARPSTSSKLRTNGGGRIDKSALAFPELQRVRDKDHLRYVAAQPCLLCGATSSDAHHLRSAQPRAMARKVGDDFTVPLCRAHHRELHHSGNESAFWHDMGVDAIAAAAELWSGSPTRDQRGFVRTVEDAEI